MEAQVFELVEKWEGWLNLHNRSTQDFDSYWIYKQMLRMAGGEDANRWHVEQAYDHIINNLNNNTMKTEAPLMTPTWGSKKKDGEDSLTSHKAEKVKPLSPTQMSW